jgi:hypothetical protein
MRIITTAECDIILIRVALYFLQLDGEAGHMSEADDSSSGGIPLHDQAKELDQSQWYLPLIIYCLHIPFIFVCTL